MERRSVLLSFTKSIRSFIFSSLAVAIPFYLYSLGYTVLVTSAVIFASLAVSTAFLYVFTAISIRVKRKLLLLSSLLSLSLLILYLGNGLTFLILAMVIGSISFAGRDLTVNQSLEQYSISTFITDQKEKNRLFSVYNFASYVSGAMASAFLFLYKAENFKVIFLVSLGLSVFQIIIYSVVGFPELNRTSQKNAISDRGVRKEIRTLASLFAVDSLGGGLVNTAVIALWFRAVYGINLSHAGLIFIFVNIITALSVIASSHLSNGIGLVKTMVYTHIISNVMLLMVPVFHSLILSEFFLFLRQSTSQMDVPARDSFVNTVIPRDARVAGNSVFLGVRNGLQIPGPGLAGIFLEVFPGGVFVSAALIKIGYDLAFFAKYRSYRL